MGKLIKKLTKSGKQAARRAYEKAEAKILVAEGKRSVKAKARTAASVSKKALKSGLIAGALAAAGVVVDEIRKRRNRD